MSGEMWAQVRWHARCLAYGIAWGLGARVLVTLLLDLPYIAERVLTVAVAAIAAVAASRRYVAWRRLAWRHRREMANPLIINEDDRVIGVLLPEERLCLFGDDAGPIGGHVHTRTFILGRPTIRSATNWRQPDAPVVEDGL